MLHREIASGKEFENLIPKSNCKMEASGTGDTAFSMQEIKAMVELYSNQLSKVAEKLETSSLITTVENVKDFIYSHFQYKADKSDQLLRSPACAWHQRYDGIDCKTYSILASSLFSEMEIMHYIRRIKQPSFEPNYYTHVYVIVPFDQKTGDLSKGYYTVDGTLEYDDEPIFTKKDDLYMSLQHYRLNAPATPRSLNGGISFDQIKGLVSNIDCIGGSSYTPNTLKNNLPKIEAFFTGLINNINNAVKSNNDVAFAENVADFFGYANVLVKGSEQKSREGWNSCSTAVIKGHIEAYKYYRDVVGLALQTWLNEYFKVDSSVPAVNETFNTNDTNPFRSQPMHELGAVTKGITFLSPLKYYDPKPTTIKAFAITPYVSNTVTPAQFNPLQFISGLSQVLSSFDSNGNSTTFPNDGTTNPDATGIIKPTSSNDSLMVGLALGGIGLVVLPKFFGNKTASKSKSKSTLKSK